MECPFQVGDEVVCIDDYMEDVEGTVFESGLTVGRVYTVSLVKTQRSYYHANRIRGDMIVVCVKEVPHWVDGYHWARFKKVEKRDISVFTKMLVTKKVTEDA
jgi:hypothetical protein